MKKYLAITLFLLNVYAVKAQTIGYLDLPVIGELWIEFKDTVGSNITMTAPGMGQNWNYLNSFTVHDTVQYLPQMTSSVASNISSLYPTATSVIAGEVPGDYNFVMTDFTGMYFDGVHSDNGIDVAGFTLNDINYTVDLLYIPIPFQFGDVVQNTSSYSYVYSDSMLLPGALVRATYSTFQDMETEGQGSLTTPLGTYNPVIRIKEIIIKSVLYEIDSFSTGNFTFLTDFTDLPKYSYKWLKSGPNCLVMTANLDENNIVTSASYFTSSGLVNDQATSPEHVINISPNPVNQGSNLLIQLNKKDLNRIEICDLSGRQILNTRINEGTTQLNINTDDYESGMYYIKALHMNGTQSVYKFSVIK